MLSLGNIKLLGTIKEMSEMSENDFYKLQGNSYRGSRYSNFVGGGVDAQGNVSDAVTENAANSVGTSVDKTQADAPPTPVTASEGLRGFKQPNEITSLAAGALPYAGNVIGGIAGKAIVNGVGTTEALKAGVSGLANKVSGGLIGSSGGGLTGSVSNGVPKPGFKPTSASSSAGGIGAAAGSGIAAAAATLLTGGDVKTAAKTGVGTAAGTYIGTAIGGPVGGFIGGTIGSIVGGRVICTQLVREGLMTVDDQILDMSFTYQKLSHIHVRGYLLWGRKWVKMMRRNKKLVYPTLKIAEWRLNEIKYQLGMREKPDYRGKAVRFIFENLSFGIGLFLEDTKETIIYKKENKLCNQT